MVKGYEQKAADEICNALNVMGVSMDEICYAMSFEHRALQADFTRLCIRWIQKAASQYESMDYDARNELECRAAHKIIDGEFDWY